LATGDEGLMIAGAIVRMWREGYVEPIVAPEEPWHLVAQQAMALILQNRGLPKHELESHLTTCSASLIPPRLQKS
jgi:ATP-dependent Lhr-like helicase